MQLPSPPRFLLAAALLLTGCSTTGIERSWVDPSVHSLSGFRKVFVAYLGKDPSAQRMAEDALAAHIRSAEVSRCYEQLPEAPGMDPARVKAQLLERGFDAAVVMRVKGTRQVASWIQGSSPTYEGSFGGSWGEPGALETDEVVQVETKVFSLAQDKLIYTARSETFDPRSTAELVDEVAAAIADDLEEKGVLRPVRDGR